MAASDYVLLTGGLAVPVAPALLLTDLEARGIAVWRVGQDVRVRPWSCVTDQERIALRRWKSHVLALLDYEPPTVQ